MAKMCQLYHHINVKLLNSITCLCIFVVVLIERGQIHAQGDNTKKYSSLTSNLLQPDINDKIIRLVSSGPSKQWNTTNTNSSNGGFHLSSEIGSNITTGKRKYEITKETKSSRQYHLSKRKLLSFLSQHLESSTSPYITSSTKYEHISQLENGSKGNEILSQTTNKYNDSIKFQKSNVIHPPTYHSNFEAHVRVTNIRSGEVYMVRERVENKRVTLKMNRYTEDKPHLCIYSRSSGFGHTVYGLECLPTVNLPTGCFCTSGPTPTPYIPLVDILEEIATKANTVVNERNETTLNCSTDSPEFSQFKCWQVKEHNQNIMSLFMEQDPIERSIKKVKQRMAPKDVGGKRAANHGYSDSTFDENSENYTLNSNNKTEEGSGEKKLNLVPLQMVISRNASNPNYFTSREALCGDVHLKYTILRFISTNNEPQSEFKQGGANKKPAPSSDIIDIHYSHTSQSNGIKGKTGDVLEQEEKYEPKEESNEFGLSPMNNRVQGSWQKRQMQKDREDFGDWSQAPEGIYCQRPDIFRRRLPELPEQFSVDIESIDETHNTVTYTQQHYDAPHNIVSFRFSPRTHSPSAIFFARFIMSTTFPNEVFNIIHDFTTQLQYTINERTGNCSVQRIPIGSPDVASELSSTSHVRLKHAKELLDVDPKEFVYSGERIIRGIPADVWVAEKNSNINSFHSNEGKEYQTTELYFSRSDWKILVGEVNAHRSLPIGMSTFIAHSKNSSTFHTKLTSHYVEFNPAQPAWNHFDISTCLRPLNRMFLKVTLDVSYSQLIQFSLQKAHDSIRKALAKATTVSPLRLSDLHLSATNGDKEGIDVWFVLLGPSTPSEGTGLTKAEKLLNLRKLAYVRRQTSLNEAYRHLAKSTTLKDVPIRLYVSKDREMLATIRRHSLQVASASNHPTGGSSGSMRRGPGVRFLRAKYTAGSMAGLGFSMAILGLCVGIFLGFLLWKRRIGLPYYLSP